MSQHLSSAFRISLALFAVFCGLAGSASAQTTLTVNTVNDSNDGSCTSSLCSLRDALQTANGFSTAGEPLTTIKFDPTVFSSPQTISLNSELPWVEYNVAIQGPGPNLLTISGNSAYPILFSNGEALSLSGLTFTNGYNPGQDGGAIDDSGGKLIVSNCVFEGNVAGFGGAIFGGAITVTSTTFRGNSAGEAGAIYNVAGLTVSGSTFSGNSGGAIVNNNGTAIINYSTFSGNSSTGGGGAIYDSEDNFGTLTVANSTFSGNSSGGNGGAIAQYVAFVTAPTLVITNNIFSGNSVPASGVGGALFLEGGLPKTDSHNVFFNNTGGDVAGTSLSESDVTAKDPMLTALGNYGGPTQTMIPLPGSAAICAGLASNIPSGVTSDQRGDPNVTNCVDAGAVQTDYALNFSTEPPASIAAGASFSAAVTLDESGTAFSAGAVTIPLSLASGDNGALSGGSAATANGIASYPNLSVSEAGAGDTLVANLTLNPGSTPAAAISATSDSFNANAGSQPQTITFNNPGTQSVGAPIALVATASSGLTVNFSSNTSSVCVVSGQGATFPMSGTCSITASQPGNGTYAAATPVTQSFSVNAIARGLTIAGTSVTVSPGANTGNSSTITVTLVGGFTGSVTLTAVITSSPTGAQYLPTFSFGSSSPVNITGASSGAATLIISTTAATSGALENLARPTRRWSAAGGAVLACVLLFGLPIRRRRWRALTGLMALMVALMAGPMSCGGSGGSGGVGGGGGGGIAGTTTGNYTVTVTGTSGTITSTGTVALTVE